MNSAFPSRKMRDCELAHTFCFWKLFRTFTGKMTKGLSLRMVFSLLFQDTLLQTVRKKSSVGKDRPLSLICPLRSSSFSEAGPQALPSVFTSVHGPACVLLVVVPGPSPLYSLRVTTTPSFFVMHSGSSLGFFSNERLNQTSRPSTTASPSCRRVQPTYRVHSLV